MALVSSALGTFIAGKRCLDAFMWSFAICRGGIDEVVASAPGTLPVAHRPARTGGRRGSRHGGYDRHVGAGRVGGRLPGRSSASVVRGGVAAVRASRPGSPVGRFVGGGRRAGAGRAAG